MLSTQNNNRHHSCIAKKTSFTYSTEILCRCCPRKTTTATALARTFRLGLNGTVRDKKMGKKTVSNKLRCFWRSLKHHVCEVRVPPSTHAPVWHTGTRYNVRRPGKPGAGLVRASRGALGGVSRLLLILYKTQTEQNTAFPF